MPAPGSFARHCLRCGTALEPRLEHGTVRPTCPRCGWIFYSNPVPAAGVILVERGRVLLVKRRYDPRAGTWCLPAGFMESGETPEQTAIRETEEETGLVVRALELFGVYAGFDDPRVRAVLVLYTASREGGVLEPGDDAIETRFFALNRLPAVLAFESHRRALEAYRERAATARKPSAPRPSPRAVKRESAPRRTAKRAGAVQRAPKRKRDAARTGSRRVRGSR